MAAQFISTDNQSDLFPESLLVEREGDQVFTTSLKVAEHFGRLHKHVLRSIKRILDETPEAERQSNFGLATYVDAQKKPRQMYHLSHDGFAILAMSFTGADATAWKWKFLAAFREMERQLHAMRDREATTLYRLRPRWQAIIRNPEMSRNELIQLTGHKSPSSITACRRRMRELGLLNMEVRV